MTLQCFFGNISFSGFKLECFSRHIIWLLRLFSKHLFCQPCLKRCIWLPLDRIQKSITFGTGSWHVHIRKSQDGEQFWRSWPVQAFDNYCFSLYCAYSKERVRPVVSWAGWQWATWIHHSSACRLHEWAVVMALWLRIVSFDLRPPLAGNTGREL